MVRFLLFPGRIRYTSVSVPYHIGNGWGGGLAPIITAAGFPTGSLAIALIYPIAVPAVCFVLALFLTRRLARHGSGTRHRLRQHPEASQANGRSQVGRWQAERARLGAIPVDTALHAFVLYGPSSPMMLNCHDSHDARQRAGDPEAMRH